MLDGNIELKDIAKTEDNRALVKDFIDTVLIKQKIERLGGFVNAKEFIQHNPKIADGIEALRLALLARSPTGFKIKHNYLHRVLAESSFVLSVREGWLDDVQKCFLRFI
jgi:predicted SnoaL-like aldol condensation-catalyzing enzyme